MTLNETMKPPCQKIAARNTASAAVRPGAATITATFAAPVAGFKNDIPSNNDMNGPIHGINANIVSHLLFNRVKSTLTRLGYNNTTFCCDSLGQTLLAWRNVTYRIFEKIK